MICPKCRRAMREEKRSFHKKRKWKCPHCGKVRMQLVPRSDKGRRQRNPDPFV